METRTEPKLYNHYRFAWRVVNTNRADYDLPDSPFEVTLPSTGDPAADMTLAEEISGQAIAWAIGDLPFDVVGCDVEYRCEKTYAVAAGVVEAMMRMVTGESSRTNRFELDAALLGDHPELFGDMSWDYGDVRSWSELGAAVVDLYNRDACVSYSAKLLSVVIKIPAVGS